jgi:hypothetical protein
MTAKQLGGCQAPDGSDYVTLTDGNGNLLSVSGGSGTVTSVSVTTANGVSGSVATPTTTPAITLTLGAITPTSISGTTLDNSPVGSIIASTGAFTTLSASSTVFGTGFSTYLASPPAIGGTAAAAGTFTTLRATSAGAANTPSIAVGNSTTGLYSVSTTGLGFSVNGVDQFDYGISNAGIITFYPGGTSSSIQSNGNMFLGGSIIINASSGFNWNGRGQISSPAGGTIQIGGADAAAPTAQTLQAQSVVAGNANTAGATFTVGGSKSNGSGGGDVVLQTTLSNAASGSQNTLATALTLKGGTQTVITAAAVADGSYDYQTPATGGTVTLSNTKYHTIVDPAGTLATLTVNMPAAPIDGQYVDVRFSQVITSLTVSGNGNSIKGNPTSAAIGSQFSGIYRAANTTWYL